MDCAPSGRGGRNFAVLASIRPIRFPQVYSRMQAAFDAQAVVSGLFLPAVRLRPDGILTLVEALVRSFFARRLPRYPRICPQSSVYAGYSMANQSGCSETTRVNNE